MNWSVHHILPRGMGGTCEPYVGRASNGVLLHGTGTESCHGYVESNRKEAEAKGFLISQNGIQRPGHVRIEHAVHGRCLLNDDGTVRRGVEVF